jgi:hypothetical protein
MHFNKNDDRKEWMSGQCTKTGKEDRERRQRKKTEKMCELQKSDPFEPRPSASLKKDRNIVIKKIVPGLDKDFSRCATNRI